MSKYPFLFGAQYYRAPTPEPECWEYDFARMRNLGFNAVKLWVQWRWSHRGDGDFRFDDVDALMGLAERHGLAVTINTIFDVTPLWLFERYPDAKQVDASGRVVEPYVVSHRQIGGHPGPCYRHPGALRERQAFLAAAVEHFRGHPAISMWDVWNEPEQSFQARRPDMKTLVCYCPHCRQGFLQWLEGKYGTIERLNAVWGRCYSHWEQVELPTGGGTITDFVDWREFHLDTMADEAAWRLKMVKGMDPRHPAYLHVVPNTMSCFNSVTCVDDFRMAEECDVFAATMNGGSVFAPQVLSAARGKVCYNVESHVNHGFTGMHQRRLGLEDLLKDFVPQIGLGIKGFLFWQYRPEVLGMESPAWGVVKPDGTDRPITRAVREFWSVIGSHAETLMGAMPAQSEVAIWKSRRNEIFHFALHGNLDGLVAGVEGYIENLYWGSVPFRVISEAMLASGELDGVKLLIMPACYYLGEDEAAALDAWVRRGGVLLCEAHLAGYNGTTGRHSRTVPGCGLAQSWGIVEEDSTSSYHLRLPEGQTFEGSMPEDVAKALRDFGVSGGRFFPIRLRDGAYAWGASRYAALQGEALTPEGSFDGAEVCIASKAVGEGWVLYCGTNLGEGARQDSAGLQALLAKALSRAGITPTLGVEAELPGTVHVDALGKGPDFLMLTSRSEQSQRVCIQGSGRWRGLFTGLELHLDGQATLDVPAGFVDLLAAGG